MIRIDNVGPIERISIPVPDGGGVVVLRGQNGAGKTTALRAAEALVRGDGKHLSVRDGATASARVDGLGATLILGRRTTRAGEVEVASLEGRLNLSDLVDPPIKDPVAADRQRIKALVSLSGTEPTVKQFAEVIGTENAEYVSEATWSGKDLLEVAAKAKRDLEAAARNKENEASMREGQAKACMESAAGVDLSAVEDAATLQAAHTAASGDLRVLMDRKAAAERCRANVADARKALDAITRDYTGPTQEQAREAAADTRKRLDAAAAEVLAAREALRVAEQVHRDRKAECDAAERTCQDAARHAATVAEYEKALAATIVQPPADDDIRAATKAVADASDAVEMGAIVRRAKAELAKGEEHRKSAVIASRQAENLRVAAGQIDDVLSRAITTKHLHVKDGRLYTETARRGATLFGELSDGERWEIAFDIAAPIVGERGLIVLPQDAWQDLDPPSREHVAMLAKERGITVLTAEATDGELRAEQFEGGN